MTDRELAEMYGKKPLAPDQIEHCQYGTTIPLAIPAQRPVPAGLL